MKLRHQRELCSTFLRYNLDQSCHFTRARIPNCHIIIGEGNAGECRRAIKTFLMSDELPFFKEAVNLGFLSASHIGAYRNTALDKVVVLGPFAHAMLDIPHRFNFMKNGTYDRQQRARSRPFTYSATLATVEDLADTVCGTSLFVLSPEAGRALGRSQSCFRLAFIVEFLRAVGAHPATSVIFEDGQVMLPGVVSLAHENHPTFLKNVFYHGPSHWKSIYPGDDTLTVPL